MAKKLALILLILMLGSSSRSLLAQVAITGQIRGVVTDASGGALPHVAVSVKGPALMSARTTATDVAGGYLFDLLPPGTYELTYAVTGYKTEVQSNVTITPASPPR
jgi:hypothetical protein